MIALSNVIGGELIVLCRGIESPQESTSLFVRTYVKEEFHDVGTVSGKVFLPVANGRKTIGPEIAQIVGYVYALASEVLGVNSQYEDFFIMAAVEYSYPSTLRQGTIQSPHEVVIKFFLAGRLERKHLEPGRVYAGGGGPNGAVLPCCIHRLKDQKQ